MDLGAEVRRLRVAGGLTQRELAEPAYTRAFVAAIESGARTPSDEALAHIAGRLGVAAEDLRHGRPRGIAASLRVRLTEARRPPPPWTVRTKVAVCVADPPAPLPVTVSVY